MSIKTDAVENFIRSFAFNLELKGYEKYSVVFHTDVVPVHSLKTMPLEDKIEFCTFIISRYSNTSLKPSFTGVKLKSESENKNKDIDLVLNYSQRDLTKYQSLYDCIMITKSVSK